MTKDEKLQLTTALLVYTDHTLYKAGPVLNSLKFNREEKQKVGGKNVTPTRMYGMWGKNKVSKRLTVQRKIVEERNYTSSYTVR